MIGKTIQGHSGKVYRLDREIGGGGFGIVYRAIEKDSQICAVKIFASVTDPSIVASAEQEIKSTLKISHENVLRIIDHGSFVIGTQSAMFIVSEYCEGGAYRNRLNQSKGVPNVEQIVADFSQILSGLQELHKYIVHRDIKPENILISNEKLKICDFGLTKFVDSATRILTFKGAGTPHYMAPEVWQMQTATFATDLYALGVMLFEVCAGRLPFESDDLNRLREHHLYTPAPRVKNFNTNVPDRLDGIIKKLLQKDPQKRHQSAVDLANDLAAVVPRPIDNSSIVPIVERMRKLHDQSEAEALDRLKAQQSVDDASARDKYMESQLAELMDEVVDEINRQLVETTIARTSQRQHANIRICNSHIEDGLLFSRGNLQISPRAGTNAISAKSPCCSWRHNRSS